MEMESPTPTDSEQMKALDEAFKSYIDDMKPFVLSLSDKKGLKLFSWSLSVLLLIILMWSCIMYLLHFSHSQSHFYIFLSKEIFLFLQSLILFPHTGSYKDCLIDTLYICQMFELYYDSKYVIFCFETLWFWQIDKELHYG